MQLPESWLRSFVNPALSTAELTHLLTMSGLEVEQCVSVAPPFSGVVVGNVVYLEQHPKADKLTVCQVDVGVGRKLGIVCGAPNVAAGMKVACALVGAKLPGATPDQPFEIKVATVRGERSQGMLCSARELGLSEDHSGLLVLPDDAPVGEDVRKLLALDDQILTIKLTPNRADCLSLLGIAREVSALTETPLSLPTIEPVPPVAATILPVRISSPSGCGRFTGRVIHRVDAAAQTPVWMKQRLERAGQRPISALVDVTNYVMLELGRPLHVYDLDKLHGGIDVRFGRNGERLTLLNDQSVALDASVLAITDGSGPIGLAGIMGGDSTKADLNTRNVFLEAAFFYPEAIAGRARKFNFVSDASHRFERGVDFENNVQGIERATRLILDICGGEPGPVTDTIAQLPERSPVIMRVARARKVIGVDMSADEMMKILARLRLSCDRAGRDDAEAIVVRVPSYRFDLSIEEDIIEEVARVYGFERIPIRPPKAWASMLSLPESRRSLHELRAALAAAEYQEVVNYSFVDEAWEAEFVTNAAPIRVLNPIGQMAVMRSNLMAGLVANVRYNLNRKQERVRVFEVGRVFIRDASAVAADLSVAGLRQPTRIAAAAYGFSVEEQWGMPKRNVDFFDVKGDVETLLAPHSARFETEPNTALHPGRSARIILDGVAIGWIGELHPKWQRKYEIPGPVLLFELECEPILQLPIPVYSEVSRFPLVRRDASFVFPDNIAAGAILEVLRARKPDVVVDISMFDLYRGAGVEDGKKSLAFRWLLQDTQKTLTDAEVDKAGAVLLEILEKEFGGKLRQ